MKEGKVADESRPLKEREVSANPVSSTLLQTLACSLGAMLLGGTVAFNVTVSVQLNRYSHSSLHAVYVTLISHALGLAVFLPVTATVVRSPYRFVRRFRWWTCLGGVVVLPSFLTIPAGKELGIQAASLGMFIGNLGTSFALDVFCSRVLILTCAPRWLALPIVAWLALGLSAAVGGVVLELFGTSAASKKPFDGMSFLWLAVSVFAGAAYAGAAYLQKELALDLGSTLRATCVYCFVSILSLLPVMAGVWGSGIMPQVHFGADWYFWMYTGLQAPLYALGISALTQLIALVVFSLSQLIGNLIVGSIVDATGLWVRQISFSWARGTGIGIVCAGYALYLWTSWKLQRETQDELGEALRGHGGAPSQTRSASDPIPDKSHASCS